MLGYYIGHCVEQKGLIFLSELRSRLILGLDSRGMIVNTMTQELWFSDMEGWDRIGSDDFFRLMEIKVETYVEPHCAYCGNPAYQAGETCEQFIEGQCLACGKLEDGSVGLSERDRVALERGVIVGDEVVVL